MAVCIFYSGKSRRRHSDDDWQCDEEENDLPSVDGDEEDDENAVPPTPVAKKKKHVRKAKCAADIEVESELLSQVPDPPPSLNAMSGEEIPVRQPLTPLPVHQSSTPLPDRQSSTPLQSPRPYSQTSNASESESAVNSNATMLDVSRMSASSNWTDTGGIFHVPNI